VTDAARSPQSFKEILEKNQQFVAHLQELHGELESELARKEGELGRKHEELTQATTRLAQLQKELTDLQNAQLQWAQDRQQLLDKQEALAATRDQLKAAQEQARAEILKQQEEITRSKLRDEDRRKQLRQLEQERMELERKAALEQKKIADQLAAQTADLDTLQNAQLQWAVDREGLLKDREAAVAKQARLEQEWQAARVQLNQEKARLVAQLAELDRQLAAGKTELDALRAGREKWQGERQRLINSLATVERDSQALKERHQAEVKQLRGELEKLGKQVLELERLREENQKLLAERSALAAKVKAMEHDWQARESSIAEERTACKRQLQEATTRHAAMQQDYEKVKGLHTALAGETGKRAEEWTAREQRLTAEKSQLKVDLERSQGELSEMMNRSTELQRRRDTEQNELERAWQQEKTTLRAQLEDAKKAIGASVPSQALAKQEQEKRALQAEVETLRSEVAALQKGKGKDAAPALAQARRDFEAKFRVIYDQSHELNSPLNAIIGFSEILIDERANKTSPEERQEFVQHINDSGKRLLEYIRELIEFAKQEAGIQESPADLMPPLGPASSRVPIILVADNDPTVKERVEPFLSHAGYEVVFAASSQEALKKAVQLQPLAILIDTQLPPSGGSGLLYDLKRETKTRNIPVVLTSKVNKEQLGFDIGQCDFLTKPIDRQQLLQMMVKFDLLADGKRGKKRPSTILLVDDDPQNVRLVKAMLKPFNMEILVADGGKAGIDLALKKKPDLIILDLMMPDVDGFDVVSKLRKDSAGREIPILIYTAKNITSEDRERLQGNIQSIIQKGDFGRERFLELINGLQTAQAS